MQCEPVGRCCHSCPISAVPCAKVHQSPRSQRPSAKNEQYFSFAVPVSGVCKRCLVLHGSDMATTRPQAFGTEAAATVQDARATSYCLELRNHTTMRNDDPKRRAEAENAKSMLLEWPMRHETSNDKHHEHLAQMHRSHQMPWRLKHRKDMRTRSAKHNNAKIYAAQAGTAT